MNNNLKKALEKCRNAAQKGHETANDNNNELKQIVEQMEESLQVFIKGVSTGSNEIIIPKYCEAFVNDTQKVQNGLQLLQGDVQKSLEEEWASLSVFKLVVYGRTKAGKSTLMETLTRGNGDSIGKGAQRTTKDVRAYTWNGLTIYDTPGIASSLDEGREDEQRAYHAAKYADLLVFLFSDDAPQQAEAKAFFILKQMGKPILGIINCKSSDNSRQYSKMRLHDIGKNFKKERLDDLKKQFLTLASNGDNVWNDVQFVYTDLHTAFLSQMSEPPELVEHSKELYELSRFADVEESIVTSIINKGEFYQYKTFIDIIYYEMWNVAQKLNGSRQHGKIVLETIKQGNDRLKKIKQRFEQDSKNRIDNFLQHIEMELHGLASSFAETNYDNKNAQNDWQYEVERLGISEQANRLLEDLADDCASRIDEFSREFSQTISFRLSTEINGICGENVTDYGSTIRIGVAIAGLGLAIAGILTWPVGLALTIIGFLSHLFTSKEEKIRKAINKMRGELNEHVAKILSSCKEKIYSVYKSEIINNYLAKVTSNFRIMQENINNFVDLQKHFSIQINERLLKMNGQLLEEAMKQAGLSDVIKSVKRISRIPGEAVLLEINSKMVAGKKEFIVSEIHKLLQEEILVIDEIEDIRQATAKLFNVQIDKVITDNKERQLTVDISGNEKPMIIRCLPSLYGQLIGYHLILKGMVVPEHTMQSSHMQEKAVQQEGYRENASEGTYLENRKWPWYEQDVDESLAEVQWDIATHYITGDKIEQDDMEAFKWAIKAAEQRLGIAQCYVGDSYFFGLGVNQDYQEAVHWYELAEETGYSPAAKYLADCYYFGDGVKADFKKAAVYYQKSVDDRCDEAIFPLGNAFYLGEGCDLDYERAVKLFKDAAEKGVIGAQNNLGNCYYLGRGCQLDYSEAYRWYKVAAENGSEEAAENIASF